LVRVQVERYAVCSYWFFGWHLASTGAFAFAFFLLGLLLGLGLAFFLMRRA
jgi:LPXTG-motif cell wall-anchored protein